VFRCAVWVAFGVASTAVAAPARAQSAAPPAQETAVADARTALEERRYKDALALVSSLRTAREARWRADALEISAIAQLMSGQSAAGQKTVEELFALEPGFVLNDPSLPSSVTSVFQAESARPHPRQVTLRIAPAPVSRTLEVATSGNVADVRIACRERGAKAFVPVAATREGAAFRVRLSSTQRHDCFALALDADDLPVGRLGSRTEPIEVIPPAPPPALARTAATEPQTRAPGRPSTPLTGRWWFWAAIGVVTVVGVTSVVVAAAAGKSAGADENVTSTQVNKIAW
jgi:hypothetical protein